MNTYILVRIKTLFLVSNEYVFNLDISRFMCSLRYLPLRFHYS